MRRGGALARLFGSQRCAASRRLNSATVSAGTTSILDGVRERFEASTDFTIGIEEEFQILDPSTLALANRFGDLIGSAQGPFAERLAGELIASEIEFRTGKHETLTSAARELAEGRLRTIALAEDLGLCLAISGVHPFSRWEEQRIIDTEHYRRVEGELGYVAWTNNTWSVHLHCGIRGADRAISVCTALRSLLPELLALSSNSPIFMGRPTRLHSTRTQVFTKSFPRCGVPDAFADWDEYAEYVHFLERANSIVESTQIWWSVRPHHTHGTIEVRICDGQSEIGEALGLVALMLAAIASFCDDFDAGRDLPRTEHRFIEENLWRAERYGLTGALIDLTTGLERTAPEAIEELLRWSGPAATRLGVDRFLGPVRSMLENGNGAIRQLRRYDELGGDLKALHAECAERTKRSAEELLAELEGSDG